MLSFEIVRGEGRRMRPLKQKYSALGWHDFLLVSCTEFSSLFQFEVRPWTGHPCTPTTHLHLHRSVRDPHPTDVLHTAFAPPTKLQKIV